jgi:hypothetical protein
MKRKPVTLLSIGKLRRSASIDLVALLEDDGRDCPTDAELGLNQSDVILVTSSGARHTHKSLIAACLQGRSGEDANNTLTNSGTF